MMVIENKFEIGQTVYLITDKDQLPRMVTRIMISQFSVMYQLCQGINTTDHYELELSDEVNILV